MARQPININWKLVDTMLEAQCPIEEICESLGIDTTTLYRKVKLVKKTNFANYARKFLSTGKRNIRVVQYNKALQGNVQMMIKWGEEYLGQGKTKTTNSEDDELKKAYQAIDVLMGQIAAIQSRNLKNDDSQSINDNKS